MRSESFYNVNDNHRISNDMQGSSTRSTTLVDEARDSWTFKIAYIPTERCWIVRSLDEGWKHVVKPCYLRGLLPTARNIAITATFLVDEKGGAE